MSENSLIRTTVQCLKLNAASVFKIKNWPEKQLNYTLALFKTSSHRTGLILKRCTRFEVVHNRSIEFADCGQLCNYTTHLFTTACVTHMDQVIKQLVVLIWINNVEKGGLIGDTFR